MLTVDCRLASWFTVSRIGGFFAAMSAYDLTPFFSAQSLVIRLCTTRP